MRHWTPTAERLGFLHANCEYDSTPVSFTGWMRRRVVPDQECEEEHKKGREENCQKSSQENQQEENGKKVFQLSQEDCFSFEAPTSRPLQSKFQWEIRKKKNLQSPEKNREVDNAILKETKH